MNWRRVWTESVAGGVIGGFCFGLGLVLLAAVLALIINLWNVVSAW